MHPEPQITVLDAGGQYCHLIGRKVRELGVYAEVRPSETPAGQLRNRKGIIISGGPASVYDSSSPTVDPALFTNGAAVLGICYGQQLMAQLLGGAVRKGEKGEYGLAMLDLDGISNPLFQGLEPRQQIWMSHRDVVSRVPEGFAVLGRTETCEIAAIGDLSRRLYGLQFHPEVVHTARGREILANFLFNICECRPDWDPRHRIALIEQEIRERAGGRNVFFFVSGGVDSTVAFALCRRALGPDRVKGVYVDTGLMRQGETEFVRRAAGVAVEAAEQQFFRALEGVRDPEEKRRIIGEEFVRVQERVAASNGLLDGHWILGQGTIYPDTIESGGTERAAVIKTHHNRVASIRKLIQEQRIIEPLHDFYKDEVRQIGRELGLSDELLERHPFPGPGLAIRCLCSDVATRLRAVEDGYILPVHSVGVQGDSRTYAPVLSIESLDHDRATELINRTPEINRVIALVRARVPVKNMMVWASALTSGRLGRLRRADAIVRRLSQNSGFDREVWQFPVILIPVGTEDAPDSVVLRPVASLDGMTAQSVRMQPALLESITEELLAEPGIAGVFYDLTHKPPGTIEWE